MAETTEQIVRQPPYIEERGEQLLASVFGDPNAVQQAGETDEAFKYRKFGLSGVSQPVPAQQLAAFTQPQIDAMNMATQGIGAFQPFLDLGKAQTLDAATTAGVASFYND